MTIPYGCCAWSNGKLHDSLGTKKHGLEPGHAPLSRWESPSPIHLLAHDHQSDHGRGDHGRSKLPILASLSRILQRRGINNLSSGSSTNPAPSVPLMHLHAFPIATPLGTPWAFVRS